LAAFSTFSKKGRIAWIATASDLRGTDLLRINLGSLISVRPAIMCPAIVPAGMPAKLDVPGTGTIPGIEKNISEVPARLSPSESTILFTVKFFTVGFFVKISRSTWEVRIDGTAGAFLVVRTGFADFVTAVSLFRVPPFKASPALAGAKELPRSSRSAQLGEVESLLIELDLIFLSGCG
jgi:hypothetical protein